MKLTLITGKICPDCKVVEEMLKEIKSEIGISLKVVDIDNMNYEFAFKLLSHQIYVSRTPAMILEEDGDFKILFSGIPDMDDLREMVRGDTV